VVSVRTVEGHLYRACIKTRHLRPRRIGGDDPQRCHRSQWIAARQFHG
jgi:hypothetical protein